MAWYTDFGNAVRNYPGKTTVVLGFAIAASVISYYAGKWHALREPIVESVTLTPDLDGDGRPDVGIHKANKRYEAAYMQEDRRTFLTHRGMLGKYNKLEEKFKIQRQSERSNVPAQLNPLDQPFNYRFAPIDSPSETKTPESAKSKSGLPINYSNKSQKNYSNDKSHPANLSSDLEQRAEMEIAPETKITPIEQLTETR